MLLKRWVEAAADFVFPGVCTGCDAACAGRSPLCDKCTTMFATLVDRPACQRCAAPLAYPDAPCPYCLGKGMKPIDRIVCLGTFDDPVRQVVHAIKYHAAWPLADYMADRLRALKRVQAVLDEADVIVPVPLHALRKVSRGFIQAELLARRLAKGRKLRYRDPLVRLRNTETQTHLHSRAKRDENMKDAFGLEGMNAVRDKRVVLVDDVMTTGATLRSAAREIRKGRPASLCAVVLAVADPKGRLQHTY